MPKSTSKNTSLQDKLATLLEDNTAMPLRMRTELADAMVKVANVYFTTAPTAADSFKAASCAVPPAGWYCTRAPGHEGPCAAWPHDDPAAPTAQQSLTAGRAVPEYRVGWFWSSANRGKQVRCLAQGSEIDNFEKRDDFIGWCDAAAPLPQVQSEALDVPKLYTAAEYDDAWGDVLWFHFYTFDEPPEVYVGQPEDTDFMRQYDHWTHCARFNFNSTVEQAARAAADQQLVTPSGALADNDGGVA